MLLDASSERRQPPPEDGGQPVAFASATAYITFTLIAINVAVFLVMTVRGVSLFDPTPKAVLPWGANFGPLTTSGQWWRLLTACFLHFGLIHIGMNMYILFQVGPFTERLFGKVRFLLLYLLTGIGGNIAGLFFHPFAVGAGASGAIFGVYGGLLGFLLVERGVVPKVAALQIAKSAGIFLIYNLIYGLARPETDIVAHAGGLLTGFAAGCLLAQPLTPGRHLQHAVRALAVTVGAALLAVFALSRLPRQTSASSNWLLAVLSAPAVTAGAQDRVMYTGTATQQDAEAMAQTLVRLGFFRAPHILILFNKTPSSASLSIPLNADEHAKPTGPVNTVVNGKTVTTYTRPPLPWADPGLLASLGLVGPQLASAAGTLPFTIRLLNRDGEPRNEVTIDTTEVATQTFDRVSYSGLATAKDAAALLDALKSCGFFSGTGRLVYLRKQGGAPELSVILTDGSWDRAQTVASLRDVARRIAPSVGGPPLTLNLLDSHHQMKKVLTIH